MKVLRSIKPYWVYLICEGIKTIEIGKNVPKSENWDKSVVVYCSKDMRSFKRIPKESQEKYKSFLGKVIGEFICDEIGKYRTEFYAEEDAYQEIRKVWIDEYCDCPEEDYEIITTNERANPNDCGLLRKACLTFDEIKRYIGNGDKEFYGWHISDLEIYDKPKELGEFCKEYVDCFYVPCEYCKFYRGDSEGLSDCSNRLTRPPQSWCYVEDLC